MASASSGNDELEELLACPMCLEILNKPRSLPCFHNFCEVCLGKFVEGLRGAGKNVERFPCPTCRSEFTLKSNQEVAEIASNYFIKNMLKILVVQRKAKVSTKCFRCQDSAINRCATCEVFMCEKCSELHDIWPVHKSHNVLSVKELNNPESQLKMRSKLYCVKHEGEILKFYCETCKELCCIQCMVLKHMKENHSCLAVSEVTETQRETLRSNCATFDEKLSEGKKALSTICEVMKSLEMNAKTAKDKIEEQKENILKIVAEKLGNRTQEMKTEVDKVYGELHSELSKQYDNIKYYLDKVEGSLSLPRNLLKRGSIEEILSSQKVIDKNIEKLRKEQPENLAPLNDGGILYVPKDIGDINVDEVVDKLGCVGKSVPKNLRNSSSILKGEIAFMKQLQEWLGEKCKWNLCYQASRDGWSAEDFHEHCDNTGPTVVLVKANDCIFGGYSDQSWQLPQGSVEVYKQSNSSFLFSLRNKDNLAPFIANIKKGQEQKAISCHGGSYDWGPRFGEGCDLAIYNNPQAEPLSYCKFGGTYQLPPGYVHNSEKAKNLLAGQSTFSPTEIEVFN